MSRVVELVLGVVGLVAVLVGLVAAVRGAPTWAFGLLGGGIALLAVAALLAWRHLRFPGPGG